jgi:hypothetical protein
VRASTQPAPQHLLAALRSAKVERLTLRGAGSDAERLSLQLLCASGPVKTYEMRCVGDSAAFLSATVDRRALRCRVAARPKPLAALLANFAAPQSDVTLLSRPGGQRLRLQSYVDPGAAARAAPGAALTTQLALRTSEEAVTSFSHRGTAPAEATVNLKDLKVRAAARTRHRACGASRRLSEPHMTRCAPSCTPPQVFVAFCDAVDADVALMFDVPGACVWPPAPRSAAAELRRHLRASCAAPTPAPPRGRSPLVCAPDFRGRITSYFPAQHEARACSGAAALRTSR